jgi:hypothetical protein
MLVETWTVTVGEDEGDELTDSDRLRAAADQGDELARWAVTVGTNMGPAAPAGRSLGCPLGASGASARYGGDSSV